MRAHVRLKPLFGLEPKSWLTAIYLVVVVAVVLGVLLGSWLLGPGTQLTVTSQPSGASVEWQGRVWGVTPLTVLLPPGQGLLTLRRPGFVPDSHALESTSDVWRSLVVPPRETRSIRLLPRSSTSVLEQAAQTIGAWSLTAPADDQHPLPPLFVPLVADLEASGATRDEIHRALRSLRSLVADHELYVDYGRAWGLWTDGPPEGLKAQAALWDGVLNPGTESKRRGLWLFACQSPEVRARLLASRDAEFQALREAWRTATSQQPDDGDLTPPAPVSTAWGSFRGVAAQWSFWGTTTSPMVLPDDDPWRIPVLVHTSAFWLADQPVSASQWSAFYAQFPQYRSDEGPSWSAALAFVDWLNAQPGRPAGLRFRLPTQQEWEQAMRTGRTLWASVQGRWEWTSSPFGTADYLVTGDGDEPPTVAPYARVVKGGGTLWGRAALPEGLASPVVGLRLVLSRVQEDKP